jgi:hypothetical protein
LQRFLFIHAVCVFLPWSAGYVRLFALFDCGLMMQTVAFFGDGNNFGMAQEAVENGGGDR